MVKKTASNASHPEQTQIESPVPPRWHSFYWALVTGIVIFLFGYEGPYAFHAITILLLLSTYKSYDEKKRRKNSWAENNEVKGLIYRTFTLSILFGIAILIGWISKTFDIRWFSLAAVFIGFITVLLGGEFIRVNRLNKHST